MKPMEIEKRREGLLRSLRNQHPESLQFAELGLAEWVVQGASDENWFQKYKMRHAVILSAAKDLVLAVQNPLVVRMTKDASLRSA